MKRKIIGTAAALITAAAATITASAEYYIGTEQNGDTVKVEVIADGATLPAIEFTVDLPEDVEIDDIETISGAFFNEDKGIFAWAGTEAPEDGTVMFSATFTVDENSKGKFTVTPAEGYEDDMPTTLRTVIISEDEESIEDEDTAESEDTSEPTDDILPVPSDDEETTPSDNETDNAENGSSDVSGDTNEDSDENPETGVAVSVAAVAVTGAAFFAAIKNKKQK